jgi:mono/diheme cytochrome c family protein
MQHRFRWGTAVLLLLAAMVGLTIGSPRLLGQTQQPGPFGYIRTADQLRDPPPAGLPNGPASSDQVAQGRYLVASSGCVDCHGHGHNDPSDSQWLSGYLTGGATGAFQIGPFKTYAKNLTPDVNTGIGKLSDRQIFNALRYGLDPDNTPGVMITSNVPGQGNFPAAPQYLAPPMPWPSWRHKTDGDLWAIVAYLKHGIKPVNNQVPDSQDPPDHWAGGYTPDKIGPYPLTPYPAGNETFQP